MELARVETLKIPAFLALFFPLALETVSLYPTIGFPGFGTYEWEIMLFKYFKSRKHFAVLWPDFITHSLHGKTK